MYSSLFELEPLEEIDEQDQFLSILYHDSRGGYCVRMLMSDKKSGKNFVSHYSNKNCKKMEYHSMDNNAYVSINTFKTYKIESSNVFNFSGIYIDLDGHDFSSTEELDAAIEKTKDKLRHLFQKKKISPPTMITYTGRGLGLYYILKKSIANVPASQKSIDMLDAVRRELTAKYKQLLLGPGMLKVDTTVGDAARVCRMPLTYNKACNRWCRLIHISYSGDAVTFYDLKSLAKRNHLFETSNNMRKQIKKAKIISLDEYKYPFLKLRLQKMEQLQEIRKFDCKGYREIMAFVYYNTAKQIYGTEDAKKVTDEYNAKFLEPLDQSEIDHIRGAVDKNVPPTMDYMGYYKLPDKWIIEKLDVSDAENKLCGFENAKRQIERAKRKESNYRRRTDRNREILTAIRENKMTYKEIAATFDVSESTVRRIAKENNITRYNLKKETKVLAIPDKKNSAHKPKRSNFVTESVRCALGEGYVVPEAFSALPTGTDSYNGMFFPLIQRENQSEQDVSALEDDLGYCSSS